MRSDKINIPSLGSHIPALDGLRGIAILLVLFHHFNRFDPGNGVLSKILSQTAAAGWIGVELFFVLSGFLITGILFDAKTKTQFFKNFYMRRILRIFPIYYISILLLLTLGPILFPEKPEWHGQMVSNQVWYWTHMINFGMVLEIGEWLPYGVSHFWSLAIEEHYYFFWPLLIFLLDRNKAVLTCIFFMIICLFLRISLLAFDIGAPETFAHLTVARASNYFLTPFRLDSLATGSLVALLVRGPKGYGGLIEPAKKTMIVSGVLLLMIVAYEKGHFTWAAAAVQTIGFNLLALFFAAALVLVTTSSPETVYGYICNTRFLRFFGKYSYSMYIFHMTINLLIAKHLFGSSDDILIFGSHVAGGLVYIAAATIATTIFALFTWHIAEKRFLALKRFFASH